MCWCGILLYAGFFSENQVCTTGTWGVNGKVNSVLGFLDQGFLHFNYMIKYMHLLIECREWAQ